MHKESNIIQKQVEGAVFVVNLIKSSNVVTATFLLDEGLELFDFNGVLCNFGS